MLGRWFVVLGGCGQKLTWQDTKVHIYLGKVFMQPQLNIPRQLLKNSHFFEDDFFKSRPLTCPETDLLLPNGQLRRYQFPTYFNDVTFNAGVFFANYKKICEQLPVSLKPVSVPGGRAMVIFASYHYGQIHEMPGYNEVIVMVPVLHKSISIPLIPPLLNNYPGMGYYILALPMTNLENQLRGQQFWGLPKSLHNVDIDQKEQGSLTRIKSDDTLDFEFSVTNKGIIKNLEKRNFIYAMKDDQLIRFESHFSGAIAGTTNWSALFRRSGPAPVNQGDLIFGGSALGRKLKNLDIAATAFQTRHCANLKSCLYLPREDF